MEKHHAAITMSLRLRSSYFWMLTIKLPTGTFEYDPAKPLGHPGGFGQVFVGRTAEGKEVAVKKLHVSALRAGHRELRIAEEFRGRPFQNVIPFIDSGIDANAGDYFVVMPKAEHNLQSAIDTYGPMSAFDAAQIMVQIVSGLLEFSDVIHRDLKPDNILFHEGKWKIADFGIARFTEEATASNTLRDYLSDFYAAPEQWRSERTTHETDVYSLGCIGFCLLTGKPPFTTDPPHEHQYAHIPDFTCDNPRIRSLISMMLRKLGAARPSLSRVQIVLAGIESKPGSNAGFGGANALAQAASRVAEREDKEQARRQEEEAAQKHRVALAQGALQILNENLERLWEQIHLSAPIARKDMLTGDLVFRLGDASIAVRTDEYPILPGSFPYSGWDAVAQSKIVIYQPKPRRHWSASLWFVKLPGKTDYRWHEVSYWRTNQQELEPLAAQDLHQADFAASNVVQDWNVAFGPVCIDDENEQEFHDRWIWLFSQAADHCLRTPSTFPIQWPPW